MRDGERVTTGSEPRRWTLLRYSAVPDGDWYVKPPGVRGRGAAAIGGVEEVEVQEVVEPGHDEQTEAALNRLDARIERANAVWQPDPRTVAAVVEALREEYANTTVCGDFKKAIDLIEERFKLSAPRGDDGH